MDRRRVEDIPGESLDWQLAENPERHPFDLQTRTARFVEAAILLLKKVPRGPHDDRLIDQLTGGATSIGAHYCEADGKHTRKDFHPSVGRCKKEAKESQFFLRMIATSESTLADEARPRCCEANELMLIFASMYRKTA